MRMNATAVRPLSVNDLENIEACDLCGGRAFTQRRIWTDPVLRGLEQWHLVRCDGCSLHFINPRPTRDTIGNFYPSDYAAHTAKPSSPSWWHRKVSSREAPAPGLWSRSWMQVRQSVSWYQFPHWRGEGRVLDIGCGSGGRYLDILHALGWKTFGMDPSAAAVEAARAKGHEAVQGIAEQQYFDDDSMDVVTMWHVLEQTHSPTQALASARRVLRPDGQLSLCVPNWGSLHAKAFGQCWQSCEPPRHLYQFTKATLRRYLEQAGFRIVRLTTRTGATSWPRAMRLACNALFGTKWEREPQALVAAFDPYVAFLAMFRFFGIGAELRVIAEKTDA
jgi:ubiquinone/menaquinone biosynthesis C-methylase UbiE